MTTDVSTREQWPALPLEEWRDTYATLHMWTQIVGKTRLALAPWQNHWWQVTLHVTARGLATGPMPYRSRTLDAEFDFVEHELVLRTDDGAVQEIALHPHPVAEFYENYVRALENLGVRVDLWPMPVEVERPIRFPHDRTHASYDADAAHRCWRILAQADLVLNQFRGRFLGKSSPSHFWWGSFDLSCTRFSGRRAPPHPGGIPNCPDYVTREAYSHECISAGWWPGSVGGPVAEPAFYAYAYPEPSGFSSAAARPPAALYHPTMREWILPYEAVRTAPDPQGALLEFLQSTYDAAADLAGWDRAALERGTSTG